MSGQADILDAIAGMAASRGMRLGQFLANAMSYRGDGHNPNDAVMALGGLFYAEDEELLGLCRCYCASLASERPDARSRM